MIVFIFIAVGIILIVLTGLVLALIDFDSSVKRLFLQADEIKGEVFHFGKVAELPLPVSRYFCHVLRDGQPYISYVRLRHHGRFKTGLEKKWALIKGEEYFTAGKPGLVWKGKTRSFTAIDSYIAGKGSLRVYLLSFFRIASGSGTKFSQGELLRWVGECVWFPTALLPGKHLTWEAIDDRHAKLIFSYKKLVVYYIVTFDDSFEIISLETKRFMGGKELETWIGKLSNYKMINNVRIPTMMQATWKLDEKDFTYAVFYLSEIEYDIPKIFN